MGKSRRKAPAGEQPTPDVAPADPLAPDVAPPVSRFVKYTEKLIHRRQLKNAPYNPRQMSDKARKKLQGVIKKLGLVSPPTWNVRSGNIVGGHQRISILDVLEGNDDYYVPVSQVDLDDKAEKAANIALNNSESQGEWDVDKLDALFKEGLDVEATGFDVSDIYQMFGDSPLVNQPEQLEALAEKIRASQKAQDTIISMAANRDDVNFYLIVVFEGHPQRLAFTRQLGLTDNRNVDGRFLAEKLGVDLTKLDVAEVAVNCDHCGHEQKVPGDAKEATCRKCLKPFPITE